MKTQQSNCTHAAVYAVCSEIRVLAVNSTVRPKPVRTGLFMRLAYTWQKLNSHPLRDDDVRGSQCLCGLRTHDGNSTVTQQSGDC